MKTPVKIFCCYAREDEKLLTKLKIQLKSLQQGGLIEIWDDSHISAGVEREQEISQRLVSAQIILLLVSPDLMSSKYDREINQAMERYERGEARIVPIILRPIYWQDESFGKLQALPTGDKPVSTWTNSDEAFLNIAEGLRRILGEFQNETDLQGSRARNQFQQSQTSQGKPTDIACIDEDANNFLSFLSLSKACRATFKLSESHLIRCVVKSSYFTDKKIIIIFVDGEEAYSGVFGIEQLHYGKKIRVFIVEDALCICYISSIEQISITVNGEVLIKFNY